MIEFMVKPPEVRLTVGDDGEVEEEHIEDTEQINLYERLRETLIYVTNIDSNSMSRVI